MIATAARSRIVAVIALFLAYALPANAREAYVPPLPDRVQAVAAEHGLVVAQEARAARIGADILRRGGNAVDAAVATGFALAVTYPRAGNIGGGGYMVIHLGATATETTIDFRETAPAAITRASFLDDRGEADAAKSRDSALGIGVPGTVAGSRLRMRNTALGVSVWPISLRPPLHSRATASPLRTIRRIRSPRRKRAWGAGRQAAPSFLPRTDG